MTQLNKNNNDLFPVFLKLESLSTLIVGGGPVATEKINALLNNSPEANITVVSIEISLELIERVNHLKNVRLVKKSFEESDLEGVDIVFVAVNNYDFAFNIRELSKKRKLLVNVADTPTLCDFYLGSIIQKGDLKIGISTNGQSPTMAKRIKEWLNSILPEEIEESIGQLHEIRNALKTNFQEKVKKLNELTKVLIQ